MRNYKISATPVTFIGWGAIENLSSELVRLNRKKILVIADPTLVRLNVLDSLLLILQKNEAFFEIYSDIIPEPTLKPVRI